MSDPNVNLDDLSVEELDALMNTGELPPPPEDAPPAEAENPPGEVAPPEEDQEPAAPPEPEVDWRALAEQRAAEIEERDGRLKEAQAHGNRLAGELGFYKNKLKGEVAATDVDAEDPQDYSNHDPDPYLRNEVETIREEVRALREEKEQREQERLAAIDERHAAQADARLGHVPDDIKAEVVAEYGPYWQAEVLSETDPERRELAAREIASLIVTRANDIYEQRQQERQRTARTASTHATKIQQRAQAAIGSGSTPAPPPRQRTIGEMSPAEADAWLKDNVR